MHNNSSVGNATSYGGEVCGFVPQGLVFFFSQKIAVLEVLDQLKAKIKFKKYHRSFKIKSMHFIAYLHS